jgi:hypothetical protein
MIIGRGRGNFLTGSDKVASLEETLSGSGLDRKYVLRIPGFFTRFFLSISTMATGCDQMSLDPLRGSLCGNFRLHMRRTYFRTGHVTDVTSGHVTSGHVTSGSTTAQHHRKYDFVHTHILLTTEDDERKPFSCV